MMGGVPANVDGQCLTVVENGNDKFVEGLFAVVRLPVYLYTVRTVLVVTHCSTLLYLVAQQVISWVNI